MSSDAELAVMQVVCVCVLGVSVKCVRALVRRGCDAWHLRGGLVVRLLRIVVGSALLHASTGVRVTINQQLTHSTHAIPIADTAMCCFTLSLPP